MVDRAEFFKVADEILAEGGREPSQRAIRERLARGGSFSELGPLFVDWATERGFPPRPNRDAVPQRLKNKLEILAAEIWSDGHRNGAIASQNERDRLIIERDKANLAVTETAARADALEEMMRAMRRGPEEHHEEPAEAPAEDAGHPPNFTARLLHEVYELLGGRTLSAKDIFAGLSATILAEGAERDGAWGPVRVAVRMREKIKKEQMFLEKDGLFRRRPDAA